jgi:hypothetical protein
MPQIPIAKPFWSSDTISNDQLATALYDGMLETAGDKLVLRRRPGLEAVFSTGATDEIQGMHFISRSNQLLVAAGGKLYVASGSSSPTVIYSALATGVRVIFAEGQQLDSTPIVYIADGGTLKYYIPGTSTVTVPSDVLTPSQATYVTWFANRFWANEKNTNWLWGTGVNPSSGLMDNTYWSSTYNPFVAEYKADTLDYLGVLGREMYVWGQEGLEVWQEDGVTPIVPIPSAAVDVGLMAPYSVSITSSLMFALVTYRGQRCVVQIQNRTPQIISDSIARQLGEYSTIADAIGYHVTNRGVEFYVLSFPTEGEAWAYDIKGQYWARWGNWNADTGEYDNFIGCCSAYNNISGDYYVGSNFTGKIYRFQRNTYTDDSETIRTEYQTAWIDWQTYFRRKAGKQFFIKSKNAEITTNTLILRYRDDGRDDWSNDIPLDATRQGQGDFLHKLNRGGMYRARQYGIVYTDPYDLCVTEIQEEYQLLRN